MSSEHVHSNAAVRTGVGKLGFGSDMELGHWVTGSMDLLGRLSRPGH